MQNIQKLVKWCSGHQSEVPVSDFGGHKSLCRACNVKTTADWKRNNPEKFALQKRKYKEAATYGSPRHIKMLWQSIKDRCKRCNIPFNLSINDIIVPEVCPIFGLKLTKGVGDCAVNVDRIIASRGYVRGNIVCISGLANRLKTDATMEQLKQIVSFYERLG